MAFRYDHFCPVARAAEILGERWTLLIVRELCCGPQRFSDLRRRLHGISPSVLTQRLESLAGRGLVAREDVPPPAPAALYRLTAEGERLRPVLLELLRFGVRHTNPPEAGDHLEPEWAGLVLEAFARRGAVPRRTLVVEVPGEARDSVWQVRGGRSGTRVAPGAGTAEATLRCGPVALLGVLTGLVPIADALASGDVRVEGDAEAAADLPRLFDLQEVMTQDAASG